MPLPMFALYLSKGRVPANSIDELIGNRNVFSWKLWSAIIGPFFLFSWRNYISWGFQFVNLVIHSFFNIHYLTELRFLSFSLLDSLIKLVTWELAYQLLENSFMYTQKRPLCTPKFLPVFVIFSKADSDIGHVHPLNFQGIAYYCGCVVVYKSTVLEKIFARLINLFRFDNSNSILLTLFFFSFFIHINRFIRVINLNSSLNKNSYERREQIPVFLSIVIYHNCFSFVSL